MDADLPDDEASANDDAVEEALRCVLAGSSLWTAVEADDWMILSAELIQSLGDVKEPAPALTGFREATGLNLDEWFSRSLGERATRHLHGPRSWRTAQGIDEALERAWEAVATISPEEAVQGSMPTVEYRGGSIVVRDVFDLAWLADRPFVLTSDGRRFSMWLGADNRYLVPAEVVRTFAAWTGIPYDRVATWFGKAGHRLLAAAIEGVPQLPHEFRIPDEQINTGGKKADYVVGDGRNLLVVDFSLLSPTRHLSQGLGEGVESAVAKLAGKFEQVYNTLQWCDPTHGMNWQPLVVLLSPMAMGLEELVHRRLVRDSAIRDGPCELRICHAPDFLDLVQYAANNGISIARAVSNWQRNGDSFLDWWLYERGGKRASSKVRGRDVLSRCQSILARR